MMKLARVAVLLTLASSAVWAQTNVGEQQAEATLPFQLTTTATFELPCGLRSSRTGACW